MSVPILKWVSDPASTPHPLSPFSVHAKDRIFISGPSGSGKTTFFRRLILLNPEFNDQIHWGGRELSPLSIAAYRKACILLSQHFSRTSELLSAWLGRRFLKSESLCLEFKTHLLNVLGWPESEWDLALSKKLTDFSGGELQAIVLCTALSLKPSVLILDESTSALDFKTEARFWNLIHQRKNSDLAVLWTSHHPHSEFLVKGEFKKME